MTDVGPPLTAAKRRVVHYLKSAQDPTTADVAAILGVTDVAARQHLTALEAAGLVAESAAAPSGRGRPRSLWTLTELATDLFPDRHGDLTVELLDALREAVGDEGLETLLDVRGDRQLDAMRVRLAGTSTLTAKVAVLAAQRTLEGYMAEVAYASDGSVLLIEHHCPVCAAATNCQGLCRTELELFQAALGSGARVERTEHLLSGDQRCVFRITDARAGLSAQ
jgi:predicted ArsR family transcriptional regulator